MYKRGLEYEQYYALAGAETMERITALEMATAYVNFMTYGYIHWIFADFKRIPFFMKIDCFFPTEILLLR